MKINIKPLSVNYAWQGKRYKTKKYKAFEREFSLHLKPLRIDFKRNLRLDFVFGFSSTRSDIDNPLKPTIDVLQKKYGFNDRQIIHLCVKKEIVKKGNEFIKFTITEL